MSSDYYGLTLNWLKSKTLLIVSSLDNLMLEKKTDPYDSYQVSVNRFTLCISIIRRSSIPNATVNDLLTLVHI